MTKAVIWRCSFEDTRLPLIRVKTQNNERVETCEVTAIKQHMKVNYLGIISELYQSRTADGSTRICDMNLLKNLHSNFPSTFSFSWDSAVETYPVKISWNGRLM